MKVGYKHTILLIKLTEYFKQKNLKLNIDCHLL